MGELAEMTMDGVLCASCGGYIGPEVGYPRYCCRQCAEDAGEQWTPPRKKRKKKHKRKNKGGQNASN